MTAAITAKTPHLVVQIVRTAMPYIYTLLARFGLQEFMSEQIEAELVILFGSLLYAGIAALEARFPKVGKVLVFPTAPKYEGVKPRRLAA